MYAGLTGIGGFWDSALSAANLQKVVPASRWDIDRAYSPQAPPSQMTIYARSAAFCDNIEQFDASAFRMSKPEATATDPQQRLLMENFAEALNQTSAAGHMISASTGMELLDGKLSGNFSQDLSTALLEI